MSRRQFKQGVAPDMDCQVRHCALRGDRAIAVQSKSHSHSSALSTDVVLCAAPPCFSPIQGIDSVCGVEKMHQRRKLKTFRHPPISRILQPCETRRNESPPPGSGVQRCVRFRSLSGLKPDLNAPRLRKLLDPLRLNPQLAFRDLGLRYARFGTNERLMKDRIQHMSVS